MTAQIYYVALPFRRSKEGYLIAGEAKECASADSAASTAERLSASCSGAIAFSQKIDPTTGTCETGRLLRSIGEVPKLGYLLGTG